MNKEECFAVKFGLLKKACVQYSYERFKESFMTIAYAAKIVKEEKKQLEAIEKWVSLKWKRDLKIKPGVELPTKEEVLKAKKLDSDFFDKFDIPEEEQA